MDQTTAAKIPSQPEMKRMAEKLKLSKKFESTRLHKLHYSCRLNSVYFSKVDNFVICLDDCLVTHIFLTEWFEK